MQIHKILAPQSFLQYNLKAAYRPTRNKIVIVPLWLQWMHNNLSDASANADEFASIYKTHFTHSNTLSLNKALQKSLLSHGP